jgi:hypothetical protein
MLDFRVRHLVHLPRGLADQLPQHLGLRRQLDERPLDRLIFRERLAEWLALTGVAHAFIDAVHRRAE